MSVLELNDVQPLASDVTYRGEYPAERLALVGDWRWLRAHLAGSAPLSRGAVRYDGSDARELVTQGTLGVSLWQLDKPSEMNVADWLTLNLELANLAAKKARQEARAVLAELNIAALSSRKVSSLNGAEAFAANAALAISTRPKAVFLGPPVFLRETREFELGILRRLAEHHDVVFECAPQQTELLAFALNVVGDEALEGPAATLPEELGQPSRRYHVRAFSALDALCFELQELGAEVSREGDGLSVLLPERASTELIVACAVRVGAPLTELVSVVEAR